MNELILYKKFTKLILKKGYKNNFFLPDIFGLLNKEKSYNLNEIKKFWQEHILKSKKEAIKNKISFYIHIPFCESRCEFCRHFYWKYNNQKELDYYLKSLISKMIFFKDTFSEIKFKTLYIGGGTPGLLNERQLKNLFTSLYKNFKFEKNGAKTLECNPVTTTSEKIKILGQFGINRISFGVQSTNDKILKSVNRGYQSSDLVKRVINNAQKRKFKRINADLIIGLYGDTPQTVIKSFCRIAALRPDSISLYFLQPTKEYLKKFYQNKKDYFDKELKSKLKEFFVLIKPVALKYDYFYLSSSFKELIPPFDAWNFISKEYIKSGKKFSYNYDDTEEIDCFGLGTGSDSYIFGHLKYQDIEKDFCSTGTKNPNRKIYRGVKFNNLKEQKLYYLLTGLASNKLLLEAYKKLFNSDLLKDFQGPINKLKKLNKIEIKGESIFLTSKYSYQRFIDSFFFFDKKLIENFVKTQ